jgi:hypothetical protein
VKADPRWDRGEGEEYVVGPQQVWKVGNHVLGCADLMTYHLADKLVAEHKPSVVYTDPPWNQAIMNRFRSSAGLPKVSYSFTDVYVRVALLAAGVDLWAEGSTRDTDDGGLVAGVLAEKHTGRAGYREVVYGSSKPYGIYSSTRGEHNVVTTGMKGWAAVQAVFESYDGPQTVFDPCCGLGGIPLVAEKVGWSSVSTELSPFRMSSALARLAKATKQIPRRIA